MNLSKQVGWDIRRIGYPTMNQVRASTPYQRLEWNRFLHAPETEEQLQISNKIWDMGWEE